MQDNALSRWLSPLMAFCLSFIIIYHTCTLGGMLLLNVSSTFGYFSDHGDLGFTCVARIALAKALKTTALNALLSLTRDADASPDVASC